MYPFKLFVPLAVFVTWSSGDANNMPILLPRCAQSKILQSFYMDMYSTKSVGACSHTQLKLTELIYYSAGPNPVEA